MMGKTVRTDRSVEECGARRPGCLSARPQLLSTHLFRCVGWGVRVRAEASGSGH